MEDEVLLEKMNMSYILVLERNPSSQLLDIRASRWPQSVSNSLSRMPRGLVRISSVALFRSTWFLAAA